MNRWFLIACLTLVLLPTAPAADNEKAPTATSPDGKLIARGDDKSVRITDAGTQKELITLNGHTGRVTAVAFSPDGKFLASGSEDKSVRLWDAAAGKELRNLGTGAAVISLSISADAKTLTVTGSDQKTRKFDIATGKQIE